MKPNLGRPYILTSLIAIVLGLLYLNEVRANKTLEWELMKSKEELNRVLLTVAMRNRGTALPPSESSQFPGFVGKLSPEKLPPALQPRPPRDSDDKQKTSEAVNWRSEMELKELEEFTTLTDAQKERLRAKYEAESEGEAAESLSDILGAELAEKFESERQTRRAAIRERFVDGEVYRLSRVLGLNSEQEVIAKQAIADVSDQIRQMREQVLPFDKVHNPNEIKPADALKTMNELQEARRTMLNQRMKEVLNEDQYNKYLEDQANSPSGPWLWGR